MKIAVTSSGNGLDSAVDSRFGRCPWFMIIDPETMAFEAIENPNTAIGGGAGIQSAQLMSEKGVETVLTGNCGPNAFRVFGAAKIKVVTGVTGTVREAIEGFKKDRFSITNEANVESHFGTGIQSINGNTNKGGDMPLGMGRGQGMGGGRGMGMGGGQGMGGGRGMGMGRGRGMGMGRGMNGTFPFNESGSLSNSPGLVAKIDSIACTGCGRCVQVCNTGAITLMNALAQIDRTKCTGCGQCVAVCPNRALSLEKA
ncbi:MAG: 4Fe-4S binding protein [Chitinispirillaceae bacterium]|nr:4Fe-4S binding protein [Chitinispirillaceae bacterium]